MTNLKVICSPKDTWPIAKQHPILEIIQLGHVFQGSHSFLPVLENISFDVRAGELVCILGPSGCGKTTLLNILSGFLLPSAGKVMCDGMSVTGPGPDRCVVFQEDALFPWLTVAENIAFGLKGKGIARRRRREMVDQYLAMVGLSTFENFFPGEISGGMKQRVALARVLILEPEILLMDEPFASLDAQTREEMQQLLLTLWHKLGHTIVFVTHDVRETVTLADRVIVMEKNPGRLKEMVSVNLQRPRNIDSDAFLRQSKVLYELIRSH